MLGARRNNPQEHGRTRRHSSVDLRSGWQLLQRRRWIVGAVLLGLSVALGLGLVEPWQVSDFEGSCVPANRVDDLGPRVYNNHQTISVSRGSIVTVQLGTALDAPWPWRTPVSSNELVLRPLPLCAVPPHITTIPVQFTEFKATSPGTATITAEVLPGHADIFESFFLTVVVSP